MYNHVFTPYAADLCWIMAAVYSYRYWPSTHASDDLAYNWWHLGVLHVLRSNARTGKSYGNASMHFYGLICSIVVYTSVHVQMYMYVHCTCTCMSQTPQIIGWYSHLICHCHCKSCMYIHLCVNLQRFHGILFWLKCQGHRSLHERDWSAANAAVVGAGLPPVSLWLHGHWRAQEGHCPHTWRRHTLCKSAFYVIPADVAFVLSACDFLTFIGILGGGGGFFRTSASQDYQGWSGAVMLHVYNMHAKRNCL